MQERLNCAWTIRGEGLHALDKKKALKKSKDIHKKIKRKRKGMKRTETGRDKMGRQDTWYKNTKE